MTTVPQVIVSLSPSGGLRLELPGPFATRRVIDLRKGETESTLLRILLAQQDGDIAIGLDGAPTEAQLRHWERHQTWPAQGCRFCISEGRALPVSGNAARRVLMSRPDVTVRICAPRATGPKQAGHCATSAEDLGL